MLYMKKRFIFPLIALGVLITWGVRSQQQQTQLTYLYRPSSQSTAPPLVVLLHGYGSNETDLFSLASFIPDSFLVVSVRAPKSLDRDSYMWYPVDFSSGTAVINEADERGVRDTLLQFLDDLQSVHPYNPKRVFLCGFSQGGILSLSVGMTHPERVAGVGVWSGRMLRDVEKSILQSPVTVPVFWSHGTQDQVISVDQARNAWGILKAASVPIDYHEYPVGHQISNAMLQDFLIWLAKHG